MSWIAFLICVFLALGLNRRLSEGAKQLILLVVTGVTLGVVYVGFLRSG